MISWSSPGPVGKWLSLSLSRSPGTDLCRSASLGKVSFLTGKRLYLLRRLLRADRRRSPVVQIWGQVFELCACRHPSLALWLFGSLAGCMTELESSSRFAGRVLISVYYLLFGLHFTIPTAPLDRCNLQTHCQLQRVLQCGCKWAYKSAYTIFPCRRQIAHNSLSFLITNYKQIN